MCGCALTFEPRAARRDTRHERPPATAATAATAAGLLLAAVRVAPHDELLDGVDVRHRAIVPPVGGAHHVIEGGDRGVRLPLRRVRRTGVACLRASLVLRRDVLLARVLALLVLGRVKPGIYQAKRRRGGHKLTCRKRVPSPQRHRASTYSLAHSRKDGSEAAVDAVRDGDLASFLGLEFVPRVASFGHGL